MSKEIIHWPTMAQREKERQEKIKDMNYFNGVMYDLYFKTGMDTPERQKINELMNQGLFETPLHEMEELIRQAKEVVGNLKKS